MNSESWKNFVLGNITIDRAYISPLNLRILQEFEKYYGRDRVSLSYARYTDLESLSQDYSNTVPEYKGFPSVEEWHKASTLEEFLEPYKGKLNNIFITVHFPEVTVENEKRKSTKIQDLYVRVMFPRLYGGIWGTRTSFTPLQLQHGYVHSHLPSTHPSILGEFYRWCLGSGPLVNTIDTMRKLILEKGDISIVPLMCMEIDNLTKVESLHGGPYNRLENMYADNDYNMISGRYESLRGINFKTAGHSTLYNFVDVHAYNGLRANAKALLRIAMADYLQQGRIPMIIRDGNIVFNAKFTDILIDITNYIMSKASNKDALVLKSAIYEVIPSGDSLYSRVSPEYRHALDTGWVGRKVFEFNGNPVTLKSVDDVNDGKQKGIKVFYPKFIFDILANYLDSINLMYTNTRNL